MSHPLPLYSVYGNLKEVIGSATALLLFFFLIDYDYFVIMKNDDDLRRELMDMKNVKCVMMMIDGGG